MCHLSSVASSVCILTRNGYYQNGLNRAHLAFYASAAGRRRTPGKPEIAKKQEATQKMGIDEHKIKG